MHYSAPDVRTTSILPWRRPTGPALLLPLLVAVSLILAAPALAANQPTNTSDSATSEETPPSAAKGKNQEEPAAMHRRDCAECPALNVAGPFLYSDTISATDWEPCVRDGACRPVDVEEARSARERLAFAAWLSNRTGTEYWVVSNRQFCSKTSVCVPPAPFGFDSWTTLQPPYNQVADPKEPEEPKWDDPAWVRRQPMLRNLNEDQLASFRRIYDSLARHRALQPPGFRVLRWSRSTSSVR